MVIYLTDMGMAKKDKSKVYDLKAAKDLLKSYIEQVNERKDIILPEDTIKIDDLKSKDTLKRLYDLTDNVIDKIYKCTSEGSHIPVIVHVFTVNIGYDRYGRRQGHERTIALVRLCDQNVSLT